MSTLWGRLWSLVPGIGGATASPAKSSAKSSKKSRKHGKSHKKSSKKRQKREKSDKRSPKRRKTRSVDPDDTFSKPFFSGIPSPKRVGPLQQIDNHGRGIYTKTPRKKDTALKSHLRDTSHARTVVVAERGVKSVRVHPSSSEDEAEEVVRARAPREVSRGASREVAREIAREASREAEVSAVLASQEAVLAASEPILAAPEAELPIAQDSAPYSVSNHSQSSLEVLGESLVNGAQFGSPTTVKSRPLTFQDLKVADEIDSPAPQTPAVNKVAVAATPVSSAIQTDKSYILSELAKSAKSPLFNMSQSPSRSGSDSGRKKRRH